MESSTPIKLASAGSQVRQATKLWRGMLDRVIRLDQLVASNQEFVFIPLIGAFVIACLTLAESTENDVRIVDLSESSRLYSSVKAAFAQDGSDFFNNRDMVVLFCGGVCLLCAHSFSAILHEIYYGGMQDAEKRINYWARFFTYLVWGFTCTELLVNVGDPQTFTKYMVITAKPLLTVTVLCVLWVSSTSQTFFSRPLLALTLSLMLSVTTLGCLLGIVDAASPGIMYDYGSWFIADNFVFYILGFVGLMNVSIILRQWWYSEKEISGRSWDSVFLIILCFAWFAMDNVASLEPLDWNATFTAFLMCRLVSGFCFLFMWHVQSSQVTMKRIENGVKIEREIQQQITTRVLQSERQIAIKLLRSMVPRKVADDLSRGVIVPPHMLDFVTVFFSDIEGFTRFAAIKTPLEVFSMLNRLFKVMDHCVGLFPGLYKVETVGDAFMVVGGLELESSIDDTEDDQGDQGDQVGRHNKSSPHILGETCEFALLVREAVKLVPLDEVSFVKVRMGIHCGPIVTGISGSVVPRFSCFGDTVNTASRMESTGATDKIHVSGVLADLLTRSKEASNFALELRQPIEVKGKGTMQTYFLEHADTLLFRESHESDLNDIVELIKNHKKDEALSRPIFLEPYNSELSLRVLDTDTDGAAAAAESASASAEAQDSAASLSLDIPSSLSTLATEKMEQETPAPQESQESIFNRVTSADFDIMLLAGQFESICEAIIALMSGVVGSTDCCSVTDPRTLHRLVRRIGNHYQNVSYHNWHHALCVVQQTAAILGVLQVGRDGHLLTEQERFILMLSALIHDVDHPGLNNHFEVCTKSSLSLLYNDQSVLENHHLALAFSIMSNRAYDVFHGWVPAEIAQSRKCIIACVLATDMAVHASLYDDLLRRKPCSPTASTTAFDTALEEDKIALLKCLLHAADISNPTRSFRTSSQLSQLAIQEFKRQAADELRLAIPVSPHMAFSDFASECKGEIGFIRFVARPYFSALAACFPNAKAADTWLPAMDRNIESWTAQTIVGFYPQQGPPTSLEEKQTA